MTPRPTPADAADIQAEIDAHIEARVQDNLARGMSMAEAEREARRRFGPVDDIARRSIRERSRWRRVIRMVPPEIGQAWLASRRRPLALVSGWLVVAIGLTTSLSAARVADAVLFRTPPGVDRPYELASILSTTDSGHAVLMSYAQVRRISQDVPESGMFAWGQRDLQVTDGSQARVWPGTLVTGAYFRVLGVRASAGRLLGQADEDAGQPVAVISSRMASALGRSPSSAVGASLRVNGQIFDVIGVTSSGFQGLESGFPTDIWLPMSSEPAISTPRVFPDGSTVRGFINQPSIGWLRGGARFASADVRDSLVPRMSAALRAAPRGTPKQDVAVSDRPWLSPFSGSRSALTEFVPPVAWAVAFTLLLTSVCLGSAFVGRLSDREREFSVRLALGATRARIARMAFLELAIVVTLGTTLALPLSQGVLAAAAGYQIAANVLVADALPAGVDVRALALLVAMATLVFAIAAVAPVGVLRRMQRAHRIESHRATRANGRWRRVLLVCQVGCAGALLSGAVLLTRSIDTLRTQPLGFDAASVTFASLDPAGAGLDEGERTSLVSRLERWAWPAGADVAFADQIPFRGEDTLFVTGTHSETPQYPIAFSRVSAGYLRVLGVPIVAGRDFAPSDAGRHVAIVSEPLAQTYWPRQSAIGEFINVGGSTGVPHEIIGIARGARDLSLRRESSRLYLPFSNDAESLTLVGRFPAGTSPAATLAAAVRALDPRLVMIRSGALQSLAWRSIEQRLMLRLVTLTIGAGSLLMVTVGVWGLAHSTLRRRWREFGVRQALGASRASIGRLALADGLVVASAGGIAGLVSAWQIGRVLKTFLFGVAPTDPLAIAAGVLLVAGAALAGSVLPARRATEINPTDLLRDDQ